MNFIDLLKKNWQDSWTGGLTGEPGRFHGPGTFDNFKFSEFFDNNNWVREADPSAPGGMRNYYRPGDKRTVEETVGKDGQITRKTTTQLTGPARSSNYGAQTFAYGESPGKQLETIGAMYRGAPGTEYYPMVNRVMPRSRFAEEGPGATMRNYVYPQPTPRSMGSGPASAASRQRFVPVRPSMARGVFAEEGPAATMQRYRYPQPTARSMGSGPATPESRANPYWNYGIRNRFAPGEQWIPRDPNSPWPSSQFYAPDGLDDYSSAESWETMNRAEQKQKIREILKNYKRNNSGGSW